MTVTSVLAMLVLLFIVLVVTVVVAALLVLLFLGSGIGIVFLVFRALNPDPNRRLPAPLQQFLDTNPKVVKGLDPQIDTWKDAAERLDLGFEELPETWTNYGYGVLSGTIRGRCVNVSVRTWGNLRYTVTSVEVPDGYPIPEERGPVLSKKTKQGMAFVAHSPKMKVEGTTLTHEAIGIRSESAEIIATVEALLDLSER
jgi:hypothetical protein